MSMSEYSCPMCKRFIAGQWCEAFLPQRIPYDILEGSNRHTAPVEGDHGMQFDPFPGCENKTAEPGAKEYDETRHPRDSHGRWSSGDGDDAGVTRTGVAAVAAEHGVDKSHAPDDHSYAPASVDVLSEKIQAMVKERPEISPFVTAYTPEQYNEANATAFLSADKRSGYALKPDGEFISVFSLDPGRGHDLVESAIKRGATHLDCFDGKLPKLYGAHGFKETGRMKWDDQYAPPGWNYEKYQRPDIVFMSLQPQGAKSVKSHGETEPSGGSDEFYDDEEAYCDWLFGTDDWEPGESKDYDDGRHPRDAHGRWTSGGDGGYVSSGVTANKPSKPDKPTVAMVSPYQEDANMHIPDAESRMKGERQQALMGRFTEVDRDLLGLRSEQSQAIGAWPGGAENSTEIEYDADTSFGDMRLSAIMKGRLGNQKQVLAFKAGEDAGEVNSTLHEMTVPETDLAKVHQSLLDAGVEYHTLLPDKNGTRVLVYSMEESTDDKVGHFAENNHVEESHWYGHGEFIPAKVIGRDESQRFYEEEIAKATGSRVGGQDVQRRWEKLRDHWYSNEVKRFSGQQVGTLFAICKALDAGKQVSVTLANPTPPIIEVPDVRQQDFFSCGAAAAMCVGRYFGVGPKTLKEWKAALGTSLAESTSPASIVSYLSSLGLDVQEQHNMTIADLRASVAAGRPVICPVQDYGNQRAIGASFAYGHWLTVIGCMGDDHLVCQDSSIENVERVPGGDVPAKDEERDANIAEPGRILVDGKDWLKVWHDEDVHGNRFVRYGISVGNSKRP